MDQHALESDVEEALAEALETPAPQTVALTEEEFAAIAADALEAVDATLLFKMFVGQGEQAQHVAAAALGEGAERQFLLLSLPAGGGALKVEAATASSNPVAGIAAAYAGLMDVLQAAA